MAIDTISSLSSAMKAGARPNFFRVSFSSTHEKSSTAAAPENISILCKAAAIPGMTLGVIEVPFRGGRRIKIPGDRTFADWTVTFISDSAHTIRKAFLDWHNDVSSFDFNSTTLRPAATASRTAQYNYAKDIIVDHLRQDGSVARSYLLGEAFPTDVGAIDLSFDSTDTISEFTVTFQYHYMNAKSLAAGVTTSASFATSDDLSVTAA